MASEHDKEYNKNASWNDFNVGNESKKVGKLRRDESIDASLFKE